MCLELLRTMCPVFSTLGKDVFHRDIAAHNFLIEDVKDNTAKFAVLDFGLAVDAAKWCREWGSRSVGGDPRYWAPPAWMMLACGHRYVANHPDSCWANQYAHRLDHYSFGMLMLEMLFALWKGPKADEDDWAESGELSEQAKSWRSSFLTTRSAWKAWWKKCVHLFQSVHNEGAHKLAAELREKCRNTKQLAIDDHCEFLRATVKKIVAPCAAVPEGEVYKKVSFVLQAWDCTGVVSEQNACMIKTDRVSALSSRSRKLINDPDAFQHFLRLGSSSLSQSMPSGSSFGSDTDLVVTKAEGTFRSVLSNQDFPQSLNDAGAMLLRLVQSPFRTDNGAGMALLQQVRKDWRKAHKTVMHPDPVVAEFMALMRGDAGAMLLRLVQSPLRTDNGAGMALLQQVQAGTLSTEQEQWSSSNYNKGRGQGGWWGGDSYYGNYEWADHRKGAGKYKHKGKTSEKHVWAGWNGSESWWTSTSGEEWLEESQNSWIGRQRSAPQWGRTKKGGKRKSAVRQYEEEAEEEETSKESTGSEHAPQATNARWRQKGKAEGKGKGSGKGKSKTSTAEPKAEQKWNPAAAKRSK
ncbi:Src42A [Symbiodinium sp. CCMP2592]|nr:Src42A [Symbiodinium sp. CCMP2592]